ncbi:MAG: fatty acid--CoA ligase [Alphaproteobacteria bacterium]|nr:fatty acid--CoA ligase [Alphaproteobacteria bacterium]
MADLVRRQARERPEAIALSFEDRQQSYAEFDRRASQVANALAGLGVRPGDRVAILARNSDRFFELFFGCAKAGAVLVPVNYRLAPPEIAQVVNDSHARLFVVGRDYLAVARALRPQLPRLAHLIGQDGPAEGFLDYAAWREGASAEDPRLAVAPDDVVLQMYTSGTTGLPKGAQLTHGNLGGLLPAAVDEWAGFSPQDVNLVCLPLFHIGGAGWGFLGLHVGCRNVVLAEADPGRVLDCLARERVTQTIFVPALILFLLQHPECGTTDFSSLKTIYYGASPIPFDLVKAAVARFGCGFCQLYGLTETTGAIVFLPPVEHDLARPERMRSCGKPMSTVELRVVDAEGKDCAPGQVGEIVCRSGQVMKGYWNMAEATAKAIRDGWLQTGDAGYLDADGYLYIHDRVKDMIVSGGENIYPAEVESALFGHPAVADVAVIGVPDEQWGETVKAIVVRKPGMPLSAQDLLGFARQRVAGYKLPRSVDFVEALPRNPSGKILKRELRRPYWQGHERQVN